MDLPRPCRARFAWTLTIAWLLACAAMVATALLLRGELGQRLASWETSLLSTLVDVIPISYGMAMFFESPGNGVILLPLTVAGAVFFARKRMPFEAVAVLAATLLPAVVVGIGWTAWPRARPDFIHAGIPATGLSAFPSGHLAMALPFYGLLAWLWLRRTRSIPERMAGTVIVVVLLTVVAACRIVLSAHWPSDLVAGLLIGGAWLVVLVTALRGAVRCSA